MAKPSSIQQERARTRIKQMIATRPSGRTKGKEKLRIGKLLGYKGKDSNIIRSVDRIITTDRNSPSARNLRNKEQVKKIDRSWRNRVKDKDIVKPDDEADPITQWVKPVINIEDFNNPNFDVWLPGAIEGIGKKIFGKRRGVIRGYYLRFTGSGKTFDGGYNINSLQGQFPLATTFGYLDNKEDLYHIWNLRIRNLFNPNIQYSCTKAIFAPNEEVTQLMLDPELSEEILEEPQLRMGYYKTSKEMRK
tara:strand:+ start:2143 stop:2886 length:744 start_codon:yes stop_codon:yes gene_type:complete